MLSLTVGTAEPQFLQKDFENFEFATSYVFTNSSPEAQLNLAVFENKFVP